MRLVIVTHFFPPDAGPGAIRPHALATALHERGHDVVVITACPHRVDGPFEVVSVPYTRLGAGLWRPEGAPAARTTREDTPRGQGAPATQRRQTSRLISLAARSKEAIFQHPDKYRGWIRAVLRWWRTEGVHLPAPDVVIATTPPVSAAVAGARLSAAWHAPLVLEFRDLWTENPYYRFGRVRRAIDRRSESRLVSAAREIVVVTEKFRQVMSHEYPERDIRLVRTGVLSVVPADRRGNDRVPPMRIGHFGSMDDWMRRNPQTLLSAAQSLRARGAIPENALRIDFYGPAGDDFLQMIERCGCRGFVHVAGQVSHEQALLELERIDVALLLMWPGDTQSMPMKATEYMALGKTILVSGAAVDTEVRHVLEGTPGVYLCDNQRSTETALLECWEAFQSGSSLDHHDAARSQPFLADTMAAALEDTLADTVAVSEREIARLSARS